MKIYTLITGFLLIANLTLAQTGVIRGQVRDEETGETLPGVNILVTPGSSGAVTDLDGNYAVQNLAPGKYNLQFSFVSFATKKVTDVEVKAGEVTILNLSLGSSDISLEEVVVEARVIQNTDNALLQMQLKAAVVSDGVSSEAFSRAGDNDAAAAIKRVTGVSVQGGKYVYVRGLGDRYSKTTLNSAEIPGLDPSRNSVQLDLFPSNLIDRITVFKTFSPDLPGDFSGGYVNIVTKDFPSRFTFQWSSSVGYNTLASLNKDFLTYEGSNTDWLGFDNGARSIPGAAQGEIPFLASFNSKDQQNAEALDQITKSFNKEMAPSEDRSLLNQSHSFSLGNQIDLFGRPFGFIVGATYQYENVYYGNGETGRYTLPSLQAEELNPLLNVSDRMGTTNVLWGALANFSYKINKNHKMGLNFTRNQSGQSFARYLQGVWPQNFGSDYNTQIQSRTLGYEERSMSSAQLKGEHLLASLKGLKVEWHSAYTLSEINVPDLRFFANDFNISGEDTVYAIRPSVYTIPTRFFRDLSETNIDNKVHFTLPVNIFGGHESKIKTGFSYLYKQRDFSETRLEYNKGTASMYNGSVVDYLSDENIGIIGEDRFGYVFGPVIQDASELRNIYSGNQEVISAYLMGDLQLSKKVRLNTGARLETTNITVSSADPTVKTGNLDNVDVLPAINFTYSLRDDSNLRLGYSRTIARPTFRELAPFASFDFIGDFVQVGNPELVRTLIDNYDLRYEIFPKAEELLAFSVFYKFFDNPIERVIDTRAQNTQYTFQNVPQGRIFGAEIEVRKGLGFVSGALENFSTGLNLTLTKSYVDISESEMVLARAIDPDAPDTRQMFAQSPYLINGFLSYNNQDLGTSVNSTFNMFGDRLVVVAAGANPDVYERARPQLNMTVSQRLNERWKLKLSGSNLLDANLVYSQSFKDQEFYYQKNRLGQTFSLGFTYLVE